MAITENTATADGVFEMIHPYDPSGPQFVDGHVIVGWHSEQNEQQAKDFAKKHGIEYHDENLVITSFPHNTFNVPVGQEDAWCKTLNAESDVSWAEREGIMHIMDGPK